MANKITVLAYVCETASVNQEAQMSDIQKYCDQNNMEPVFHIENSSEAQINDFAYRGVLKDIETKRSDTVLCYRLDILNKDFQRVLGRITNFLSLGVRIISTSQKLDFGGENAESIYPVFSALFKSARESLRDKRIEGIEKAKAEGKYKGRREGATKAKYKKAWVLHSKGMPISEIAKSMNVSAKSATRYINRSRSEIIMKDFMTVAKQIGEEKGINASLRASHEDGDNAKYPILKFAWGDTSEIDESDYTEIPRELVQDLVKAYQADSPEVRENNKKKILETIRDLYSEKHDQN